MKSLFLFALEDSREHVICLIIPKSYLGFFCLYLFFEWLVFAVWGISVAVVSGFVLLWFCFCLFVDFLIYVSLVALMLGKCCTTKLHHQPL